MKNENVVTRIRKKPLTLGLEYELYDEVRSTVIAELRSGEALTGAVQRWITLAIREKLQHGERPVPVAPIPPGAGAEPGSLAEARMKITYYEALRDKPGQSPQQHARCDNEAHRWAQELEKRREAINNPQTEPERPAINLDDPRAKHAIDARVLAQEDKDILMFDMQQAVRALEIELQERAIQPGSRPWYEYLLAEHERHKIRLLWAPRRAPQYLMERWDRQHPKELPLAKQYEEHPDFREAEPQGQYVYGGERGERLEFVPDEPPEFAEVQAPAVDDYQGDDIV